MLKEAKFVREKKRISILLVCLYLLATLMGGETLITLAEEETETTDAASYAVGEAPENWREPLFNPYGFTAYDFDNQSGISRCEHPYSMEMETARNVYIEGTDKSGEQKRTIQAPQLYYQDPDTKAAEFFTCLDQSKNSAGSYEHARLSELSSILSSSRTYEISDPVKMSWQIARASQSLHLLMAERGHEILLTKPVSESTFYILQAYIWALLNGITVERIAPVYNSPGYVDESGQPIPEEVNAIGMELIETLDEILAAWEIVPEVAGQVYDYYGGEYLSLPMSPGHVEIFRLARGLRLGQYELIAPGVFFGFKQNAISIYCTAEAPEEVEISLFSSPLQKQVDEVHEPMAYTSDEYQPLTPQKIEADPLNYSFKIVRKYRVKPALLKVVKRFESSSELAEAKLEQMARETSFVLLKKSADEQSEPEILAMKNLEYKAGIGFYLNFELPDVGDYEIREISTAKGYVLADKAWQISHDGRAEPLLTENGERVWNYLLEVENKLVPVVTSAAQTSRTTALTATPTNICSQAIVIEQNPVIEHNLELVNEVKPVLVNYQKNEPVVLTTVAPELRTRTPLPATGESNYLAFGVSVLAMAAMLFILRRSL